MDERPLFRVKQDDGIRVKQDHGIPSSPAASYSSDDSDNLDSIQLRGAEGSADRMGSSYAYDGGLSYNPELRRMGLKVGRDGNLHRVGGDARQPDEPDEGPVVGWEELHRKQFGH